MSSVSRGQAAVEMALLFPAMLVLLFLVIEMGRVFLIYTEVTNAAREGARYGVVHPGDSTPIAEAVRSKVAIVPPGEIGVTVTYDDGSSPVSTPVFGDRVVVTVTHDLNLFIPVVADLVGPLHIEMGAGRTILGGE